MVDKQFIAVKALIEHDEKILILRESAISSNARVGMYGLPGGRVKVGEDFREGLQRELLEETGLHVEIGSPIHVDEWRPTVHNETWQIIGVFFVCSTTDEAIILSEEHDASVWITPGELDGISMMEQDKKAIQTYWSIQ